MTNGTAGVRPPAARATSSRPARTGRGRSLLWPVTLWLGAVCAGLAALFVYSFAAGAAGHAPARWPGDSNIHWQGDQPQLVMVAHPHCSCTRASIAELSLLMTRLRGRLAAHVLFLKPEGAPVDWERTDLYQSAAIITGVTVHTDVGGEEVQRFGAATSGQVYLYDSQRRLVFSGGITPSRSHQGDNVGRRRIVDLVTHGSTERDTSTVYGCSLSERDPPSPWLSWFAKAAR